MECGVRLYPISHFLLFSLFSSSLLMFYFISFLINLIRLHSYFKVVSDGKLHSAARNVDILPNGINEEEEWGYLH